MRTSGKRLMSGILLIALLLSLCAWGAAEDGVEYDEDGGKDGSVTYLGDDVVRNPDGSITVESGQLGTGDVEEENPNAMTGDEAWAKGMAIAARKNGTYTPTAYHLGDNKWTRVEVVYMGLARSLVILDGETMFVNTCDLSWETEAPDNQVLAVVKSKSAACHR